VSISKGCLADIRRVYREAGVIAVAVVLGNRAGDSGGGGGGGGVRSAKLDAETGGEAL
jgi:hypothetical protein